jgi:hypothetical protein
LEHGAFLLERVIITLAAAEAVLEVLIVFVIHIGFLGVNATLKVGLGIGAQRAGTRGGNALGATVACEVPFLENLNKGVLAMTLDGTGIANTCWSPGLLGRSSWRRVARKASKNVLSKRSENVGTRIDALWISC